MLDQRAHGRVHPRNDRLGAAEVGRQRCSLSADLFLGSQELRDVGAAEAIDALLRVADHGQPARQRHERGPVGGLIRGRCSDSDRQLQLNWICVLELVEEQVRVPLVQLGAHVVVGGRELTGKDEQVVELQLALTLAHLHRLECELSQEGAQCEPAFFVAARDGICGGTGSVGDSQAVLRQHGRRPVVFLPFGGIAPRLHLGQFAEKAQELTERQFAGQNAGEAGELRTDRHLGVVGRGVEGADRRARAGDVGLQCRLGDVRGQS